MVLEHLKRIVKVKRCTVGMGSNYLANYLINFEKNDVIELKILSILEKMLTAKKDWTGGNMFGTQTSITILKYLRTCESNLKATYNFRKGE